MEIFLKSLFFVSAYLHVTKGCNIDGVTNWLLPLTETILDTYSGNIFNRSTSDIVGISNIIHNEGLNAGPYVTVEFTDNNRLVVSTNSNYTIYEELETAMSFTFSVTIDCLGGTRRILVFEINVSDTNNNDPQFKPTSNYEFAIAPPLPPGFLITNCINDIIVRDIDLTTERIDFTVEGSPLFEIVNSESSSVPKEFKAVLRTTTFIRSIPDPIILTLTATDVDRTNDPPRSATATVKLLTDGEFQFPDEPIFSQTFYLASYNTDDGFVLQENIYLRQGYDSQVVFSFQTQHSQYFELIINENQVSFKVNTLPEELYKERQIYIIVKAERQYTSGATATVILQLPDVPETEDDVEVFDKVLYKGQIEDGVANHEVITITGYNGSSVFLFGEYASSFEATLLNDKITVIPIASATLPTEKSHIAIALQAGRANAVLVFEILSSEVEAIESFDKVLYRGILNNGIVTHETITLSEYKDSEVLLSGEYAPSFEASYTNGIVSVQARTPATFPTELTHIALTLQAGSAKSVLLLNVNSSEPEIESFDSIMYKGNLENGIVSHDVIILSNYNQSYILLSGDYASSFESSVSDGKVSVQTRESASLPSKLTHVALTLQAGMARAVLVLEINEPGSEIDKIESFDKVLYVGNLNNGVVSHDVISLSDYTELNIILSGDYASSFESSLSDGNVLVQKRISATLPPEITHITLILQAGRARAVLVLEVTDSGSEIDVSATFDKILYTGKLEDGNVSHETITIRDFSGSNILIAGVHASLFESTLSNGVVTVRARASVEFPTNLTHIALTLQAERASAVLLLDVIVTGSEIDTVESFDKVLYSGNVNNGVVSHDVISLSDYTESTIILSGDYASSFESTLLDGKVMVQKHVSATLPPEIAHTTLTLQAGRARAVLVLEIIQSGTEVDLSATFDQILYIGKLEDGNVSHETITIRDFSGPNILIAGVHASLFESSLSNGVVTIRARTSVEFPKDLTHIALTLQAERASAVLLLDVIATGSEIDRIESFDRVLYNGILKNGVVSHDVILLSDYTETNILLSGDYASSFESSLSDGKVLVQKQTSATLPPEITHITLTLQAGRANAVMVLEVHSEIDVSATFDKILYTGKLEDGNVTHETITIRDFSDPNLIISGDYASSFESSISNGVVSVRARTSSVLPSDLTHVTLILQAARARSVLLLEVVSGSTPEEVEAFDKILYTGSVVNGIISHEVVTISQYNGNILLSGEHASLFESTLSNGAVTVTVRTSAIFPTDLTHTALTLQAGRARAVLLLDITTSNDQLPSVTFDKPSYFLWADVGQTGVVGRVSATVNNGDTVIYSLEVNDDHLRSRITVNNNGAISLSDVAQVGVYTFSITATAQNSQARASAPVTLRVDDLRQCPVGKGLPPLIVLERLEEEPHRHLVTLNRTEYPDCRYSLSNSWPVDQSWLYTDNDGLHAEVIDREHKSIAFMTLSQIQVELRLHCDSDEAPATKRSLTAESLELGSDNYGSNRWVLADTIKYDERRSFVNLIVNDINDNAPIFIGKDDEPIYIGYPIPEIEDVVLPRALIEVKATDADIGENAALIYSSTEDVLAVAPLTGLVHVRNNAELQDNARLTVIATDQNGRGLSGTLDFVVMLLDKHQIAVVTIQDAFLDDENIVIDNLSSAIGYELKVLRTVIVSESNENTLRKKRDITSGSGASLQLYVYGLEENKPVDVTKLTSDITNSNIVAVNVARALSLQDHLDRIEICPVQGIGLLVATIILAVLLLILILGIALWFFLKWRKTNNYEKFSDRNSVVSRSETAEFPKIENITKPRLSISELKRSERRLQEMLDIPIQDVRMEPEKAENKQTEPPPSRETIVNFSTPEKPIVIQSIDKLKDNDDESEGDDEFGEQQKQKPRKSVVTFNENVEKIIHLEDGIEDSPESDIEIFRF